MNENDPFGQVPNDEKAFRIAYLIAGYIRDTLSEKEHIELDDWVTEDTENQRLFEELTDPDNLNRLSEWKDRLPVNEALQRAKRKADIGKNRKWKILSMLPYAAAILVLCAVGFLAYHQKKINVKISPANTVVADMAPGTSRAVLKLSSGRLITLDSTAEGDIATDGNAVIKKENGTIGYHMNSATTGNDKAVYNEIKIPRGGEFKVVLPDGTRVWLNSASVLRYPTAFADQARNVELSGEAYFEVAKDASKPFTVKTDYADVTVLGTHFNVNAYTEDSMARVTLLEGSVKINESVVLVPDQEALVDRAGQIIKRHADTEMSVAWKDGLFIFRGATIRQVMEEVSRWYDADVVYDADIKEHFNAIVPRNSSVTKLLELLEGTGSVHFKITDKKITVMK